MARVGDGQRASLTALGVLWAAVAVHADPPTCALLGGSYSYQICGGANTRACPAGLECRTVGTTQCGLPSSCSCDSSTGATTGCTDDCSGVNGQCLPPQGQACAGNVSISFGGTCSGADNQRTRNNATLTSVCDRFPIQHSPMGPVFQAYGFVISTGGACWSNTQANCTAIANNLARVLAGSNHGQYSSSTWGCAATAVTGQSNCFTVDNGTSISMETTAVCSSAASTTAVATTASSCTCIQVYSPVCAGGVTYSNSCYAQCAGHTTWTNGACATTSTSLAPTPAPTCPPSQPPVQCLVPPCSTSTCPLAPAGATCTDNYCGGCNAEWRTLAGTLITSCTAAPTTAPTPAPTCICPAVSAPVCAGGVTYSNSCFATCAGHTSSTRGACSASSSSLSDGDVAAISVITIVIVAAGGVLALMLVRRRQKVNEATRNETVSDRAGGVTNPAYGYETGLPDDSTYTDNSAA